MAIFGVSSLPPPAAMFGKLTICVGATLIIGAIVFGSLNTLLSKLSNVTPALGIDGTTITTPAQPSDLSP